jgi:hypothetical protein
MPLLHLGLDAGGTQTRWALADANGALQAEGSAPPITGLMLLDAPGRAALAERLLPLLLQGTPAEVLPALARAGTELPEGTAWTNILKENIFCMLVSIPSSRGSVIVCAEEVE